MFYSYRKIDGYNCPINVILSRRGLGKTFGCVMKGIYAFTLDKTRFVYVVETNEMVKTLSQNRGEKFFASIITFLRDNPSCKNTKMLTCLCGEERTEVTEGEVMNKIQGGTIIIAGETAGYIVSFNDFANLKRNNFVDIKYIIIDEFIPENIDIRSRQNAYKIVSLVQSIARLKEVKIYLLGNTIRLNDIVLSKLGLDNIKAGTIKTISDKYGKLVVCHLVDNNEYPEFLGKANTSVAGRLASILNEDNLEKNEYKNTLPKELEMPAKPKSSHMIFCLHGDGVSVRVHATKDYSEYYVMDDYGKNVKSRICLDKKFISPVVKYYKDWEEVLLNKYENGRILFDTSTSYIAFKSILKLDLNS